MHILHTVLYTFPKVLKKTICLWIKSFFSWWSFPLFLCPYYVIQGWYCKENKKIQGSTSVSEQLSTYPPPPQPNINPNLLSIDFSWVRGGVGGQLPGYNSLSRVKELNISQCGKKKKPFQNYFCDRLRNTHKVPLRTKSMLTAKRYTPFFPSLMFCLAFFCLI